MNRYVLIFISWALAFTTFAQPNAARLKAANLNQPIPRDPAVKIGKLPNGLTYYIRKNTEPKKRAELRLVVRAGSVLEDDDQQGLAHFMEHMAFNGTKNFPKNELVNFLQTSGVRFGADLNAYTSFDETVYQLPVPTDSAKLFERAFQILEDWAHNATLDTAEINKERGVVLEEWRLGRGAQQRLRDKYFPLILNDSRYANRLPIGKEDLLRTFKPEQLQRFYRDWYRPDLMAVIAVGDFDVAKTEALIRQKFSRIPAAKNPKPRNEYVILPHADTKVVIATDPEQPNTVVQVIYKQPEIKERTLGDLRESVKRSLFNAMLGNRIQELTQQANPPFLYGASSYGGFLGNLDAFTSVAVAKSSADVARAIRAVLDENARVRQFGFTATELARARQELLASVEQAYKERNKSASSGFAEEYVANFTDSDPFTSIEYNYQFLRRQAPSITLAELNALAGRFITNQNRAVVITAPEKDRATLPSIQDVLTLVDDAGKGLTAYVDQTLNQPLLAKLPTPGNVVAEKALKDIGATEWTLSNGVRVVLKPTDFKNDQILFSGSGFGGTSLYDLKEFRTAQFASTLATLGGTGAYNQIQLGKFLAGKQLNVNAYVGELNQGISGSATPRDFETALQLLYSYVTQPRLDTTVIAGFLSNQRAFLQQQQATPTPQRVFQDTVQVTLGGGNPRRLPLTPAGLDQINVARAFNIYRERFASAAGMTFVFVGNFQPATLRPLVERYLGGLPASGKATTFRDLGIRIPAGQISKTVYKGVDPKAQVSLVYSGDFVWNEANAVQVDALAEVLEIKLIEKLREEEAGVYGVGVSGTYGRYPVPRYTFRIGFGCAPENVEKLIARVQSEITTLKEEGASSADIAKFQAETRRSTEVQLKDNNFWLSYLTNQYYNGDDPAEVLRQPQLLQSVTPASTKQAASQYFGPNVIRLVLLPETKVSATGN